MGVTVKPLRQGDCLLYVTKSQITIQRYCQIHLETMNMGGSTQKMDGPDTIVFIYHYKITVLTSMLGVLSKQCSKIVQHFGACLRRLLLLHGIL